jgi:hypothetical protein
MGSAAGWCQGLGSPPQAGVGGTTGGAQGGGGGSTLPPFVSPGGVGLPGSRKTSVTAEMSSRNADSAKPRPSAAASSVVESMLLRVAVLRPKVLHGSPSSGDACRIEPGPVLLAFLPQANRCARHHASPVTNLASAVTNSRLLFQ